MREICLECSDSLRLPKPTKTHTGLYPMAGVRPSEGNGKSGSLCVIQSTIRAHPARVEKAPSGISCQRTGQYWTTQSIFDKAVRLGEKVRLERAKAHFIGGLAKGA